MARYTIPCLCGPQTSPLWICMRRRSMSIGTPTMTTQSVCQSCKTVFGYRHGTFDRRKGSLFPKNRLEDRARIRFIRLSQTRQWRSLSSRSLSSLPILGYISRYKAMPSSPTNSDPDCVCFWSIEKWIGRWGTDCMLDGQDIQDGKCSVQAHGAD